MKQGAILVAVLCATGVGGVTIGTAADRAPPAASAEHALSAQIIVRFRGVPDPTSAAYLTELSKTLGTTIAYVRPTSGGGHLLRVSAANPDVAADLARRLEARPDVVYAQPDALVRPQ